MKVLIEKLSNDFKGIAHINNKIIFIPNTLPGEIVNIEITLEKKDMCEGRVISYIKKSPDRVNHLCKYYGKCGGCEIPCLEYKKEILYKKEIFVDIMKRYSDILTNPDIISSIDEYKYRNKITLRVFDNKLSLVEYSSNKLIPISECLLVNDNINNVIKVLNTIDLSGVKEVIIRGVNEIMVIINGEIDVNTLYDKLKGKVYSIILNNKNIYNNDSIIIDVNGYLFNVFPLSFFQVNTNMISKLYDKVLEYAGFGKSLLDLYCGSGTIGIYLSKSFDVVRGVEINRDAITGANINKKINNIKNISFEHKKSNEIDEINEEVVIVDPPRAGLDDITIDKLLSSSAKKIVYVSCNPITLARDLKLLSKCYEFKDVTLFDMFPHTAHVESVSLLERKRVI